MNEVFDTPRNVLVDCRNTRRVGAHDANAADCEPRYWGQITAASSDGPLAAEFSRKLHSVRFTRATACRSFPDKRAWIGNYTCTGDLTRRSLGMYLRFRQQKTVRKMPILYGRDKRAWIGNYTCTGDLTRRSLGMYLRFRQQKTVRKMLILYGRDKRAWIGNYTCTGDLTRRSLGMYLRFRQQKTVRKMPILYGREAVWIVSDYWSLGVLLCLSGAHGMLSGVGVEHARWSLDTATSFGAAAVCVQAFAFIIATTLYAALSFCAALCKYVQSLLPAMLSGALVAASAVADQLFLTAVIFIQSSLQLSESLAHTLSGFLVKAVICWRLLPDLDRLKPLGVLEKFGYNAELQNSPSQVSQFKISAFYGERKLIKSHLYSSVVIFLGRSTFCDL
uniref:G_PROTEIN_RECEP_F2_4 domain-containing protein n=1 Tax=Ascaris lumbricoides TaxID=6252 RepID=A0A0M3I0S6_ASCLU